MRKCVALFIAAVICLCSSFAGAVAFADTTWETIPEVIELERINYAYLRVKGMNRIVGDYSVWTTDKMDSKIRSFNSVLDNMDHHIPVFLYYVESSRSHPMQEVFSPESELYLYLKEHLHADGYDHLKYSTFKEYCDYFYSTDHHWNYRGSYQGYVDIVHMLKGPDEPVLEPVDAVTFPLIYNGSYSEKTNTMLSKEPFTVYRFDKLPNYTAFVKGKKIHYDRMKQYFAGKYGKGKLESHYSRFYGGSYGKLLFRGESSGKGRLLVFEDSMSNAIKALLIAHYDEILFIDTRYYENEQGKKCSMKDILSSFPADQILILTCNTLFTDKHLVYP